MDFEKELRRQLIGTPLGSCRFFEPTRKFADYMQRSCKGRGVYDVGAGAGHVAAYLRRNASLSVVAIDMHRHQSPEIDVHMADGTDFLYNEGCVVMLCRPCHGAFVEQVIEQAIACRANVVFYVGLERNVEDDLGDFLPRFKEVCKDAGDEGELVWRMNIGTSRKTKAAHA